MGCGDGITEVYLSEAFPDAFFCGIDISAESVSVAAERGTPRCEYEPYDGGESPTRIPASMRSSSPVSCTTFPKTATAPFFRRSPAGS